MAKIHLLRHKTFLNAARHLVVPVVQLSPALVPPRLRERGVILQAILGFYTPSNNIKFIPASYMLETALASGQYKQACMLVENSSGNFALSLAACARQHGLKVTAIVSDNISSGKLPPLHASGVRVIKERDAIAMLGLDEPCGGVHMARLLAKKEGWINLGQYGNHANPESYAKLLAPQILKETNGKISVFGAAVGTTGTLIGLGGSFKKEIAGLETLAVIPHAGDDIPGCRDDRRLREVSFDWKPYADHKTYVGVGQAFRASLEMWEAGIPAGPSSGAALVGIREFLLSKDREGKLDGYRSEDGSVVAMFPCADTLYPYMEQAGKYCLEKFGAADPRHANSAPIHIGNETSLVPVEAG